MKLKFPILDEKVVTMKVAQKVARKCYKNSLCNRRGPYTLPSTEETNSLKTKAKPLYKEHGPKPVGGIKVQLFEGKTLRIGVELSEREQESLLSVLWKYLNAFT